jgi:hypothetical protein
MPGPYLFARCAAFGLATALACGVTGAGAQAQTVRYGVLAEDVRAQLEHDWRDAPAQLERAYCVRRARFAARRVLSGGVDSIIYVLAVRPADAQHVTHDRVESACPPGTPQLHTHAATACPRDVPRWCVTDGPSAYGCQPSRGDYEKLASRGDAFGVVQCGRRTFRFYYPSEYGRASPAPPAVPRPPRGGDAAPPRPPRSTARPR